MYRFLCVMIAMSVAFGAAAQEEEPSIRTVKSARGIVNALHVNIRSGPSTNYYILNTVNQGTELTVYSFRDGWYEVDLPEGSHVWVYSRWVKVDVPEEQPLEPGSPATGTVEAQSLNVRAAANMEATVVAQKNRGDTVEILGQAGDWYKIKPPQDTRGWIYARYVDLKPGVRVAGMPLPGRTAVPQFGTDMPPLPGVEGGVVPGEEQALPEVDDFRRAQQLFNVERRRPAMERDFRESIRLFNKVLHNPATDQETRESARAWLKKIFRMVPRQKLLDYMQEQAEKVDVELQQIKRRYEPQIEAFINKLPRPRYTARGVLYPAEPGDRLYPYRLKLANVTLYLIRTDRADMERFVGKEVGVIGEVRPAPQGSSAEVLDLASIQLAQ